MDDLGKAWKLSLNLPCHNYFALTISSTNIQNFHQYLHVCAQLQKTPIKLLRKLHGQLTRKETPIGNNYCYFSHNCPPKEAISFAMASHHNFIYMLQCIQTIETSLQNLLEECVMGFKFKQNLWLPNWLLFKTMKQAQKQPNCEIRIIGPKFIRILSVGFVPMSMSNHFNQCH
jgi:hypothetical protein